MIEAIAMMMFIFAPLVIGALIVAFHKVRAYLSPDTYGGRRSKEWLRRNAKPLV